MQRERRKELIETHEFVFSTTPRDHPIWHMAGVVTVREDEKSFIPLLLLLVCLIGVWMSGIRQSISLQGGWAEQHGRIRRRVANVTHFWQGSGIRVQLGWTGKGGENNPFSLFQLFTQTIIHYTNKTQASLCISSNVDPECLLLFLHLNYVESECWTRAELKALTVDSRHATTKICVRKQTVSCWMMVWLLLPFVASR